MTTVERVLHIYLQCSKLNFIEFLFSIKYPFITKLDQIIGFTNDAPLLFWAEISKTKLILFECFNKYN